MEGLGEHNPDTRIASFAQTVIGFSHKKRGTICQDASRVLAAPDGSWHIAAVSDGHGDPTCPRSDKGSQMAVDAACETLAAFAGGIDVPDMTGRTMCEDLRIPSRRATAMRRLTDSLLFTWRNTLLAHYRDNLLTDEETALVGSEATARYARGEGVEHLYGATLICALWLKGLLILVHQGDGVCRVLHPDGTMDAPVPDDPRCYANVTTSLCDPDAAEGIRHAVVLLDETPVCACVLASDGVENSFASPVLADGFMKSMLVEAAEGNADDARIADALAELSQTGSGDDMSIAALFDASAVASMSSMFAAEVEKQQLEQRTRELEGKRVSMMRKREYLKEQSVAAAGKLERREMSLDELREAIQKRRAGEEMLAQAIDELKEERERREWKHRNWGFWADFTSLFADASKRRQLRDQDARMANEIAALNADIVKAKKTREDIRHKREELEAALAHRESEHDVDAEKALSDFEEYEARYRALEAEIEQLKQTMERISE